MDRYTLHLGDCLDTLRAMPACSVDSIVTDPPYGLSFMGKRWDYDVPSVEVWAECLRVLKPGGHLLAFAGTRTQHRMAVRIEDAGFEIRDMIAWVYGSGFPKSLDVSKAIDKTGAASSAWFGAWLKRWREERGISQKALCESCGFFGKVNRGGTIANWELGLGSPTVEQFNRICQVLNLPFDSMQAAEREVIGKRRAAPGVAFSSDGPSELDITAPATDAAAQWSGWGTALKPALEPITVARKPLAGTVAANVLAHGAGALNIDGCRIAAADAEALAKNWDRETTVDMRGGKFVGGKAAGIPMTAQASRLGRWPSNLIHDGSDEVVALFPAQAGASAPVKGTEPTANGFSGPVKFSGLRERVPGAFHADAGSAARFFYCAKTSRKDRNEGLQDPGPQFVHGTTLRKVENTATTGNTHPTVKPTDLMAYLCRLVTPPGGIVLDPFMGSGSTGKAAMREGFQFIGCELDAAYLAIAQARIKREVDRLEAASGAPPSTQLEIFA